MKTSIYVATPDGNRNFQEQDFVLEACDSLFDYHLEADGINLSTHDLDAAREFIAEQVS